MGDLSSILVLVVEANSTLASITREQLYAAGVSAVSWARDIASARQAMETCDFSAVVVSLDMEAGAGRGLVEEMRQAGVLRPSTVVLYLTERPTFARVMEAAETCADGCIVRPYKADLLLGKLAKALRRNQRLKDLYQAVQRGDGDEALRLAAQHIETSPDLINYCSRLAVELLLQQERPRETLSILQALPAAQSMPWVLLASARAELIAGRRNAAQRCLSAMLDRDPTCGDAHDLLARLQVEQGELQAARASLNAACAATPGCMIRTQHAGALAFFCNDAADARLLLNRARTIGEDSRLLDGLSLYLLGVLDADAGALAGMRASRDQLAAMAQRHSLSTRLKRMHQALVALYVFRSTGDASQAFPLVERLAQEVQSADFRGEDCAVVAITWSRLRSASGDIVGDLRGWLSQAGLRLVTGRGMLGYLSAAVGQVPGAVAALEACHAQVMQHAEEAVGSCSDPAQFTRLQTGLRTLYARAKALRNSRLLDLCVTLAQQHRGRLGPEAASIIDTASSLSARYSPGLRSISGIARAKRVAPLLMGPIAVTPTGPEMRPGRSHLVPVSRPGSLQSGFVDLWFDR